MLTERAFESFKEFIETHIAYAKVEYGGASTKMTLQNSAAHKN